MSNQEKALNWFLSKDINARLFENTLLIEISEFEIEISEQEVNYRAELWEEEENDDLIFEFNK